MLLTATPVMTTLAPSYPQVYPTIPSSPRPVTRESFVEALDLIVLRDGPHCVGPKGFQNQYGCIVARILHLHGYDVQSGMSQVGVRREGDEHWGAMMLRVLANVTDPVLLEAADDASKLNDRGGRFVFIQGAAHSFLRL
jgi:hypothetical protein